MTAFRALTAAVLAGLSGLSIATPSYAGTTYQIPATIASDCSVDVTQPVLSWIASVPDNSILQFGSGACYRIDGTLELRNRKGLDFEGNGATFRTATTAGARRSQWRLVGGSHFIFRNMTIRGGNPTGGTFFSDRQWQHAFDLRGVAGVEIDHANASDLYGDCVYIGRGYSPARSWTSNVHVHNSSCDRNGRMGIAVVAGRDVLVETTSLSQMARTAFDIEPNGAGFGAQNVTFRNNQVSGVLPGGFFTAIGEGPVDSVTVSNNTAAGVGIYIVVLAPQGQRRSNIKITGNSSDAGYYAAGSAGMKFERVDGLTVTGNIIPLSGPNMALAWVSESCNVNVSGNRFPGGVVEARISPYSCTNERPTAALTPLTSTSTSLRVRRSGARLSSRRGSRTRRAHGRVRGSRTGRVVIRLERIGRAKHRWVKVRTRKLRLGPRGKFKTRLRRLKRGRWRARARFQGTRNEASSQSPYRYFRVR